MALLGDETSVRDLLQDVFLKLATGRVDPADIGNERAYLLRMVHHAAIDRLRRTKVRRDHAEQSLPISSSAAPSPTARPSASSWKKPSNNSPPNSAKSSSSNSGRNAPSRKFPASAPNTAASRYRYVLDKLRNLLRRDLSPETFLKPTDFWKFPQEGADVGFHESKLSDSLSIVEGPDFQLRAGQCREPCSRSGGSSVVDFCNL